MLLLIFLLFILPLSMWGIVQITIAVLMNASQQYNEKQKQIKLKTRKKRPVIGRSPE